MWLQYMGKAYQNWVHEVDSAYHLLRLRHVLIQKGLQRRANAPCELPTPHPGPSFHIPLGK